MEVIFILWKVFSQDSPLKVLAEEAAIQSSLYILHDCRLYDFYSLHKKSVADVDKLPSYNLGGHSAFKPFP